jgi:hypothetical protein
MNNSEIQLRDTLSYLLNRMDADLLQRMLDYASGLLVGSKSDNSDWWDDLTPEQQALIEKGKLDIQQGRGIPHEEVKKQIQQLFEQKRKGI